MKDTRCEVNPFINHTKRLYEAWQRESDFHQVDSICIVSSDTPDMQASYSKCSAMQSWLLSFEFPKTILLLTRSEFVVVTSPKKAEALSTLRNIERTDGFPELVIIHRPRTQSAEEDQAMFQRDLIPRMGRRVGLFSREAPAGPFAELFMRELEGCSAERADVTPAVAALLAVKDVEELAVCTKAAQLSSTVMGKYFRPQLERIIDMDEKVGHIKLAEDTEDIIGDPQRIRIDPSKINPELTESCYTPIVQSVHYDLRPSAESDEATIQFQTITASLGARYMGYCSNIARTFLIDPTKEQEHNYALLLNLEQIVLKHLTPGRPLNEIMRAGTEYVRKHRGDEWTAAHLVRNCGFVTGLEYRESRFVIRESCTAPVRPGMVFIIIVGFKDLTTQDPDDPSKTKIYSLLLSDTAVVKEEGTVVWTKHPKSFKDISYTIRGEEEEEAPPEPKKPPARAQSKPPPRRAAAAKVTPPPRRTTTTTTARRPAGKSSATPASKQVQPIIRTHEGLPMSYSGPDDIPSAAMAGGTCAKLHVDMEHETLILPINNKPVPFHVSNVKSCSLTNEEDYSYLRIDFFSPGISIPANCVYEPAQRFPECTFLREVVFRSANARSLNNSARLIRELCKRIKQRQRTQREEESLVIQEDLILSADRRIPKLAGLAIRPSVRGRRSEGVLEAHTNGFRFTSNKRDVVDIVFPNIKYAFFQPASNDVIVIIHFHLRQPIMVGKKKTNDIQFFTEVMESARNLSSMRSRAFDADEIEEERRERDVKRKINDEFRNFCRRVEEQPQAQSYDIGFDSPDRDYGFFGVPHKNMCFVQPAGNCLVELSEMPFTIIPIEDLQLVFFERVQLSLRNFDLVLIYKDYNRNPVSIKAVDMKKIDAIKQWLGTIEVPYYEGPRAMNWNRIMSTIRADPAKFEAEGAWNFLEPESEDEVDEASLDEGDDEYNGESGDDSESYESEASDEGDDDEDSFEEEEEEGKTWDELEAEAERDDKRKP